MIYIERNDTGESVLALLFDIWKKWRNKIMARKLRETLKETSVESAESILKYIKTMISLTCHLYKNR